ncbi:hypothetical protein AgCh_009691 [Apium graveolens]
MIWVLRTSDENSIGLHENVMMKVSVKKDMGGFGKKFSVESGLYVGGTYMYVDNCDVDEMSVLELGTMLEEAFGPEFWFFDLVLLINNLMNKAWDSCAVVHMTNSTNEQPQLLL